MISKTKGEILNLFKEKPYLLNMGAGSLSKIFGCEKEVVYQCKKLSRKKEINTFKNFPKILLFDLETSPMISYHWGHWQQNIYLDQVIENPILLTWSAKWLYSANTMSDKISTSEVLKRNDSRIVDSLWAIMDEADIVIAHYGDKFDIPMMNSRFILNNLPPVKSIKSIDTKAVASKNFKFPSNKLDALAGYFGFNKKLDTDFMLWRRCMEGDQNAIEEMRIYNIQDVDLLEEVYLKLRSFVKSHPNVAAYMDSEKELCSMCGSDNVSPEGHYHTNTSRFIQYRCGDCGALSRGRKNILDKKRKKNLLTSIPR